MSAIVLGKLLWNCSVSGYKLLIIWSSYTSQATFCVISKLHCWRRVAATKRRKMLHNEVCENRFGMNFRFPNADEKLFENRYTVIFYIENIKAKKFNIFKTNLYKCILLFVCNWIFVLKRLYILYTIYLTSSVSNYFSSVLHHFVLHLSL